LTAGLNSRVSLLVKESYEYLRRQEDVKYDLLRRISSVVKKCRSSVKASYAQEFPASKRMLDEVQRDIMRLAKKASEEGVGETWPPMIQTYQEFLEAVLVYWFTSGRKYRLRLKPPPASILYAVSDFIGELKRVMLEYLRASRLKEAEETYRVMVELYESISTIALGDSVLPGFKRKIDVNRASVESAFSILNEELRRKAFLSSMEKYFEQFR